MKGYSPAMSSKGNMSYIIPASSAISLHELRVNRRAQHGLKLVPHLRRHAVHQRLHRRHLLLELLDKLV